MGNKLPYTAEEIEERLGATTAAFPVDASRLGASEVAAIRAAGISRIEVCGIKSPEHFDFGSRQQAADVVRECREAGRRSRLGTRPNRRITPPRTRMSAGQPRRRPPPQPVSPKRWAHR